MKPPIFIIGNPRSGTSLLRLMLTCHPSIVIPPECGFALWLAGKYGGWSAGDNDTLLSQFVTDLLACKKMETWGLAEAPLIDHLRSRRSASYAELAAAVYEHFAARASTGFTRWGDKNNYYLHHIGEIEELFPDAVFLHIVRDGRNVACSYRGLKEKSIDSEYAPDLPFRLADVARHWKSNLEIIRRSFDRLSWENVVEVRFEDLVTAPEQVLRQICVGLGEQYHPSMIDYHRVNREQRLEPEEFLQWKAKTLRPPIAAEATRYQRDLEPAEREEFESIAGAVLERYGYL